MITRMDVKFNKFKIKLEYLSAAKFKEDEIEHEHEQPGLEQIIEERMPRAASESDVKGLLQRLKEEKMPPRICSVNNLEGLLKKKYLENSMEWNDL